MGSPWWLRELKVELVIAKVMEKPPGMHLGLLAMVAGTLRCAVRQGCLCD